MQLQLEDRVILVVGGNGYIGRAIVDRLRDEGATAVPASRSGGEGIVLDAADDRSVEAGVSRVLDEHGRLDGVVVTAAPRAQTLDHSRDGDPSQVLEAVEGKALTFLRVANAVLPHLVETGYGRVVAISGQNAYLSSSITGSVRNAALMLAAKSLADGAAGTGVTVNTVNPGTVSDEPAAEVEPGRPGESGPVDIANLVAFLVSPLAGAISGAAIPVGHRVRGVAAI